ncbi:hypothetical protein Zmor_022957 [Zophobas morio]|uniref:Cytochrome P450 9e2 n=1 Tax=Zophobas morio TaxID=2755281 RepID=A0AA38M6M6_9CUCU|nr:hypothetical protein Zmor_022957 [Zophobas morio]
MWWIIAVVATVVLGYRLLIRPHRHWLEKGVKQGAPRFIFGDFVGMVLQKQSLGEMVKTVYDRCPNTRYSGFYQLFTPIFVLKDPDLIKQVAVKDFDHFQDHRTFIPEGSDPLWANNLVALTGKKWRDMRTTLSPAFTSSKIKYMFTLISQSGEQFVQYFLKKEESLITIEMKDSFTRFTNDVIANTAFGVECDSLEDSNNEFYTMGKKATDLSIWRFIGYSLMPGLFKLLKVTLFSKEVSEFFSNLVETNIHSRQKHGIVRPDMIHLLVEARKNGFKDEETEPIQDTGFATAADHDVNKTPKNTKIKITDQDIASQALSFFFAGFDSVSALMCFMSYELALNPDVQTRLIQEVDETVDACKGKLTYESLLGMKYMDMVVSETLRKWPSSVGVDRVCTKPYIIDPKCPEEKPVHLEKNDVVWLPIFGLHRDPQYYPEPERFDPERFNDGNKANIKPYTYLPFGHGPRNCIGSRLALLEAKTLFFYVLSHFEIVPVEKTQIPLVLSKKHIILSAENGFWLGLKRRSDKSRK